MAAWGAAALACSLRAASPQRSRAVGQAGKGWSLPGEAAPGRLGSGCMLPAHHARMAAPSPASAVSARLLALSALPQAPTPLWLRRR